MFSDKLLNLLFWVRKLLKSSMSSYKSDKVAEKLIKFCQKVVRVVIFGKV